MNAVEPIRDINKIIDIADYLRIRNERDYVMFLAGIYLPIRISDLLRYKVRDLKGKTEIKLYEKKTHKVRMFPINDELKEILDEFLEGKKDYEYIFASRQINKNKIHGPITRQRAYDILSDAAREFGLEMIGCHTLRKTFGYLYYQEHGDIVTLQEIFGHSDISITKRYIGVNQDTMKSAIKNFSLKKKRKLFFV